MLRIIARSCCVSNKSVDMYFCKASFRAYARLCTAAGATFGSSFVGLEAASELSEIHVVGGHGGILGDGTEVYKPLQKGSRGKAEAAFYKLAFEDRGKDVAPATFMPEFRGIIIREEAGGIAGHAKAYLVLEDITRPFLRPSIMDIKVGVQVSIYTRLATCFVVAG